MKTVTVRISRACNNSCPFCEVADWLDGSMPDARKLRDDIIAARAAGAKRIVLTGGEPTLSGQLVRALAYIRGLGLRTGVVTNGRLLSDIEKIRRLQATGLHDLIVSVHGADAETHNALTGDDPVCFEQVQRTLDLAASAFDLTLRTVLTTLNQHQIDALLVRAAELGASFELRRLDPDSPAPHLDLSDVEAHTVLERTLAQAETRGVPFVWAGFDGCGLRIEPCQVAASPLTPASWRILRSGALAPSLRGGAGAPPNLSALAQQSRRSVSDLALELAARGAPLVDRSPALGGRGETDDSPEPTTWRPLLGRVHVLATTSDAWLALSVLPGLAHALRERGADTVLHTPWRAPFDPTTFDPPRRTNMLGRMTAGLRRAVGRTDDPLTLAHPSEGGLDELLDPFLASLDLDGDLIVAPDLSTVASLRRRGITTRVHVLDRNPLEGLDGELAPDDVLRSAVPELASLYALASVPLRHLSWRPSPMWTDHLPTTDPAASRTVLRIGGDHLDPYLADLDLGGLQLRDLDDATPAEALAAIAGARFIWCPVAPRRHRPPPLRWVTAALAAGVPVLATEVHGLASLVRPGAGLLVRPHDRRRMSAALASLDDSLIRQLSAGTRATREAASVERWAHELISGAPHHVAVPTSTDTGPWWPW